MPNREREREREHVEGRRENVASPPSPTAGGQPPQPRSGLERDAINLNEFQIF